MITHQPTTTERLMDALIDIHIFDEDHDHIELVINSDEWIHEYGRPHIGDEWTGWHIGYSVDYVCIERPSLYSPGDGYTHTEFTLTSPTGEKFSGTWSTEYGLDVS